jgi:hypothetical protein
MTVTGELQGRPPISRHAIRNIGFMRQEQNRLTRRGFSQRCF